MPAFAGIFLHSLSDNTNQSFLSNFCTQKFAVSKGSAFGRVWDSVLIPFLAGKFLRTSFCKSSENETCFILMPAPSKVRFFRKSECGPTQPAPRLLSFHEEKPHLCFLRCHTFLCAVPRMGKAHSPNFLQEPCGLTQPAPEVPFFSKRKEPKIRQRGSILFGNTS